MDRLCQENDDVPECGTGYFGDPSRVTELNCQGLAMSNHSHRSSKLFSGIDATAFASIMVVLVLVELIVGATAYNPHHGSSIDLPRVLHADPMPGALREY